MKDAPACVHTPAPSHAPNTESTDAKSIIARWRRTPFTIVYLSLSTRVRALAPPFEISLLIAWLDDSGHVMRMLKTDRQDPCFLSVQITEGSS